MMNIQSYMTFFILIIRTQYGQTAEAVKGFSDIYALVSDMESSIDKFNSLKIRDDKVKVPLKLDSDEDFNVRKWVSGCLVMIIVSFSLLQGHHYYIYRDDWRHIQPKLVDLNTGLHELGDGVYAVKEDIDDKFTEVIQLELYCEQK